MLARLLRSKTMDGEELADFALAIMRGEHAATIGERIDVMKWIADRGWGKTPEVAAADDGEPIVPPELVEQQLENELGPTGVVQ